VAEGSQAEDSLSDPAHNGGAICFAGIWEENEDSEGQPIQTFAIITTNSNPLVALVHNRMPVILRKETERQWIDYDITQEKLFKLLASYPANLMQMYEISTRVNRTTEDSPEIIKPVQEASG